MILVSSFSYFNCLGSNREKAIAIFLSNFIVFTGEITCLFCNAKLKKKHLRNSYIIDFILSQNDFFFKNMDYSEKTLWDTDI